ncbi:hypothetical protein NDA16_003515 [Ustilago loliicola]|nr:hypothetical protein NDA16_003515 [Ustilago loliicola]
MTEPLDYPSLLSDSARNRMPSAIRSLFPAELIPGMVSLLSGKPNSDTFPFQRILLELKPQVGDTGKAETVSIEGSDLDIALQGILPSLVAHKAKFFEAATDSEGVEPSSLDNLLSNWSTYPSTRDSAFPKFLYTTPTGANPSGTTASDDRKRQVLSVTRKHNLLLLEDDPYYFLSFQGLSSDADPVTRQRGKSYFQLEAGDNYPGGVGRVLRFDSFSKILSAGLRLGFVTGPKEILDAIDLDTSSRNLQTSGTSQAIAYALLSKWGIDGFLRHADNAAKFYQDRLERFESSAKAILQSNPSVATWVTPTAGMFLWIKLRLPSFNGEGSEGDSFDLISNKAKAAGVLALPGVAFKPPSKGEKKTSAYVRTSFSQVPMEQVDEAFKRLRKVVEEAWAEAGLQIPA